MFNGKSIVCLIVAVALLAIGGIPILASMGILPAMAFITSLVTAIGAYILAGSGVFLIIEGLMEEHMTTWKSVTIIAAVVILGLGALTTLSTLKIIGFSLPFLNLMVFNVIFVIEGAISVIAAFNMGY